MKYMATHFLTLPQYTLQLYPKILNEILWLHYDNNIPLLDTVKILIVQSVENSYVCVCAHTHVCMYDICDSVCVRACVCVCACVRACVHVCNSLELEHGYAGGCTKLLNLGRLM